MGLEKRYFEDKRVQENLYFPTETWEKGDKGKDGTR
jgi:hypothetical protein